MAGRKRRVCVAARHQNQRVVITSSRSDWPGRVSFLVPVDTYRLAASRPLIAISRRADPSLVRLGVS